jgi:hypothetical protein
MALERRSQPELPPRRVPLAYLDILAGAKANTIEWILSKRYRPLETRQCLLERGTLCAPTSSGARLA